jgi:hypothetical protein
LHQPRVLYEFELRRDVRIETHEVQPRLRVRSVRLHRLLRLQCSELAPRRGCGENGLLKSSEQHKHLAEVAAAAIAKFSYIFDLAEKLARHVVL